MSRVVGVGSLSFLVLIVCFVLASAEEPSRSPGSLSTAGAVEGFRLYVDTDGLTAVPFEDLASHGLPAAGLDTPKFLLSHRGSPIPFWIEGPDESHFGPGDRLLFLAERLRAEHTDRHAYDHRNTYELRMDGLSAPTPTMAHHTAPHEPKPPTRGRSLLGFRSLRHLEQDELIRDLPNSTTQGPPPAYWRQLSHLDTRPFEVTFSMPEAAAWTTPVEIAVRLRGLSDIGRDARRPAPDELPLPGHRLDVYVNGRAVGFGEWNRQDPHLVEIAPVPADVLKPGDNTLSMWVPRRYPKPGGEPLFDLVLLDWIRLKLPANLRLGEQERFEVVRSAEGGEPASEVRFFTSEENLELFTPGGSRLVPLRTEPSPGGGSVTHVFGAPSGDVIHAVPRGTAHRVADIEPIHAPRLRGKPRQADYLIITHPRLKQAIEPLASFHREAGLSVEVVDVRDVYREFHHGVVHPAAIRDFIAHTRNHWLPPAPRFVLLVGDADRDGRGLPGDDPTTGRHLIPTGSSRSFGHTAASDNGFVAVEGDDVLPDLAIGRFPVAEPAEVKGIVHKILRYAQAPLGPWRARVLWASSLEAKSVRGSQTLAQELDLRGFAADHVQPAPAQNAELDTQQKADANRQLRRRLRDALGQGPLLAHFIGHGARHLWMTGYPQWGRQLEMFHSDDIEILEPRDHLPVVLSMTCASGPFDSSEDDSMAERFLHLPDRGAVAVIAASWRNAPSLGHSRVLLEELTHLDSTVGEALQRAKVRIGQHRFVETYNLFGDPAMKLQLPKGALTIEAFDDGTQVRVAVPYPGFNGQVLVQWIDGNGEVLASRTTSMTETSLVVSPHRPLAASLAGIRAYAWDTTSGRDAFGTWIF